LLASAVPAAHAGDDEVWSSAMRRWLGCSRT